MNRYHHRWVICIRVGIACAVLTCFIVVSGLAASFLAGFDKVTVADGDVWSHEDSWNPVGVPNAIHDVLVVHELTSAIENEAAIVTIRDELRIISNSLSVGDTLTVDGNFPDARVWVRAALSATNLDVILGSYVEGHSFDGPGVIELSGKMLIDEPSLAWGGLNIHFTNVTEPPIRVLDMRGHLVAEFYAMTLDVQGNGLLDLDGLTETGYIDVGDPDPSNLDSDLLINGDLFDPFGGSLNISNGRKVEFQGAAPVQLDGLVTLQYGVLQTASTLEFLPGGQVVEVLGGGPGASFIESATTTFNANTSLTIVEWVIINGDLTLNAGSIVQIEGELYTESVVNAFGPIVQGSGQWVLNGGLHVGEDLHVEMADGVIIWDGFKVPSNTTVDEGRTLTLSAERIHSLGGGAGYTGTATILGGLIVNTPEPWELDGSIVAGPSASTVQIGGSEIIITDGGLLHVVSNTNVSAPIRLSEFSSILIDDLQTLELHGFTTHVDSLVTGDGTLRQFGDTQVVEIGHIATVVYDWDGNDGDPSSTTIVTTGHLTIDSTQIDLNNPATDGYDGSLIVRGVLDVNTFEPWRMEGDLNLHTGGAINGSEMNVTGDATFDVLAGVGSIATISAPLRIEQPVFMNVPFGVTAWLEGTTTVFGTSDIDALRISGAGTVRQLGDLIVEGTSLINVDFYDWDGNEQSNTTVQSGGKLTIIVQDIDLNLFDGYDGDILLEPGPLTRLSVQTSDNAWSLEGTMTMMGGGVTISGDRLDIASTGRVGGTGTFTSTDLHNFGTVAPAHSEPGSQFGEISMVLADYVQHPNGTLEIEIGGPTPWSEHDLISTGVLASATLDGTLDISLVGGFIPNMGDQFMIVEGPFNGQFTNDVSALGFDLIDVNGDLIAVFNGNMPCQGDLDGNGTVNTGDLLALFAQWGTDGPADFDGNGVVNTADLLILFANWGPCP